MSLISTDIILKSRTPEKKKYAFMYKGTSIVEIHRNSFYVLIKLAQTEECISSCL